MGLSDLEARYNSFQKDAVSAIVKDFTKKSAGRYLLVIPTGGGKTYTAVKSICALFDDNVLSSESDKILWVAHRNELLEQAENTFKKHIHNNNSLATLGKNIDISMVSKVNQLLATDTNIKIVVIDEAHHAAAISYQPIFNKPDVGILGLTATPSRHDGKPLDFEKESYSIGFPELVKKGIILKPTVRTVVGGRYEFSHINDDDLESLNNEYRNKKIISEILSNSDSYKKIIIYVGTKRHARDLHQLLLNTALSDLYESISYILGGNDNSRNQNVSTFIEEEKSYNNSILINVQKLTEGYDDPKVNTVLMAAPSKSKLYYMQAIGRAIRRNPEDDLKSAHIVEIDDDLPNIRYRIDNRWLYSDISDALEPAVKDFEYSSNDELRKLLSRIYTEYSVPKAYQTYPEYNEDYRYSFLLFKQYVSEDCYVNFPILIDNENRLDVSNMFNFISERMPNIKDMNYEAVFRMISNGKNNNFNENEQKQLIFDAMVNAYKTIGDNGEDQHEYITSGYPWTTFVSLQYREKEDILPDDLLEFIKDMVNKEEILELINTKNYEDNSLLIRLPLPLDAYIGEIVTNNEFMMIDDIVNKLKTVKQEKGSQDHRNDVNDITSSSILPIEVKYIECLSIIVRDSIEYSYPLRKR